MFPFIRSKKITPDFSFLGTDMHNHFLPGLDDGVKTMEETLTFFKKMKAMGYHQFYCTPHIIEGMYPNTPENINNTLQLVNERVKYEGIEVQVKAAAEYMADHDFEQLLKENRPLLTFGGNYVLIEMSYVAPSSFIDTAIFQLKLKGLQPVLAHPERYGYLHHSFNHYVNYLDRGCLLQLNLLSITGYYGPQIKKIAEKLLREDMISFLGTDIHHQNHLDGLQALGQNTSIMSLLKQKRFLNNTL